MFNTRNMTRQKVMAALIAATVFLTPILTSAQTRISMPSNKYSLSDDIQAGRQAAAQVRQQMPLLNDSEVHNYVENVGRRLVAAIPPEFQHTQFRYTFDVVNARDINAFALPGGPMFVNRGMIEAARNEGEMAGVMAHEISHVALRHGTAQATKAQKYQWGAIAGAIAGAIIGGPVGSVVGQGSQMAIGTYFLKYGREYERQADLLGAQIMARAGYDPIDLANMFRTIESQGSSRGPEWLSDHPNPGNRYDAITREAAMLRVSSNTTRNSREFSRIQARLRGMGSAPSMSEIAQSGRTYPNENGNDGSNGNGGTYARVNYPSTRYRTYSGGNLFSVSIPDDWRQLSGSDAVTFAPEGGYGQQGITHGVLIGLAQTRGGDLAQTSDEYLRELLQGNSYLRRQSGWRRTQIDGNTALSIQLAGTSQITGRAELVNVFTTTMRDGNLLYLVTVAPQNESGAFSRAFQTVLNSLRLNG